MAALGSSVQTGPRAEAHRAAARCRDRCTAMTMAALRGVEPIELPSEKSRACMPHFVTLAHGRPPRIVTRP